MKAKRLSVFATAALFATGAEAAPIIYRETFHFCAPVDAAGQPLPDARASGTTGWIGIQGGSEWKVDKDFLKVKNPTHPKLNDAALVTPALPVRATPQGPDQGYLEWKRATTGGALTIYTEEIGASNFNFADLGVVHFRMLMPNAPVTPTPAPGATDEKGSEPRIAIRVNDGILDTWYVTALSRPRAKDISPMKFELDNFAYGKATFDPTRPQVGPKPPPRYDVQYANITGKVTAVGVMFIDWWGSSVGVDEFEIEGRGTAIQETVETPPSCQPAVVTPAPTATAGVQPTVDPGASPTPTTDPAASPTPIGAPGETPSVTPAPNQTPVATAAPGATVVPGATGRPNQTPGAARTPAGVGTVAPTTVDPRTAGFCVEPEKKPRIRIQRQYAARILGKAQGKSLESSRDRAILTLLYKVKGVKPASLVGLGRTALTKVGKKDAFIAGSGRAIKLERETGRLVRQYARTLGKRLAGGSFLFVKIGADKAPVDEPLCLTDIQAINERYSKSKSKSKTSPKTSKGAGRGR